MVRNPGTAKFLTKRERAIAFSRDEANGTTANATDTQTRLFNRSLQSCLLALNKRLEKKSPSSLDNGAQSARWRISSDKHPNFRYIVQLIYNH